MPKYEVIYKGFEETIYKTIVEAKTENEAIKIVEDSNFKFNSSDTIFYNSTGKVIDIEKKNSLG